MGEKDKHYLGLAHAYLGESKSLMTEEDYTQASEKLRGASPRKS